MIRRASYVRDAEFNADTALILRLIQGTPNPPALTEAQIGWLFDKIKEYHFIDTERGAVVRMVVDEVANNETWDAQVLIPWWMAEGDTRADMLPVMAKCSRQILTDHPEKALWPCWGSFPADPSLSTREQDAASKAEAESYRVFFPRIVVELQPDTRLWRARTTLEDVVKSAEAVR